MAKSELAKRASGDDRPAAPKRSDIIRMLDQQRPAIEKALPRHVNPDHFVRVIQSLVRMTPRLAQCDPMTVIAGSMQAAQLGMEPGPLGQCYLIPRKNRKTGRMEASFQLGYKGLLKLAQNSGQIAGIIAEVVYEHDTWSITLGDNAEYVHEPAPWGQERGAPIGCYCVVTTKDGGRYRAAMSEQELTAHAQKYSEAVKSGRQTPWTDPDQRLQMWRKTVLMQALKLAPMEIELAAAIESDAMTVKSLSKPAEKAFDYDVEAEVVGDDDADDEADEVVNTAEAKPPKEG
jgi:recombination protein RecT